MTTKLTTKQFNKLKCASCIWLCKVDKLHMFCPFIVCFKELEKEYERQIESEKQAKDSSQSIGG